MAILDATVDEQGGLIHHEVLETDMNGHTPDSLYYTPDGPSCIEIVAKHDLDVSAWIAGIIQCI